MICTFSEMQIGQLHTHTHTHTWQLSFEGFQGSLYKWAGTVNNLNHRKYIIYFWNVY